MQWNWFCSVYTYSFGEVYIQFCLGYTHTHFWKWKVSVFDIKSWQYCGITTIIMSLRLFPCEVRTVIRALENNIFLSDIIHLILLLILIRFRWSWLPQWHIIEKAVLPSVFPLVIHILVWLVHTGNYTPITNDGSHNLIVKSNRSRYFGLYGALNS